MSNKPIVLFSGGLDSTVLLWSLRPNVKAISFNYDQRHVKEIDVASRICKTAGIEHVVVDLAGCSVGPFYCVAELIKAGSQTGDQPVPEGHYAEESMKATIVPNRNAIMISIAIGWAVSTGSKDVYTAVHAGDHAIYPDCRPEFIVAMQQAVIEGNKWNISYLQAPFVYKTKAEIVKIGAQLNAPLDQTWSCYNAGPIHCGACGTCVERKEAFQLAGVVDPTEYEK
jgi:7-cyano-7-deazaguanine synthase